MEDKISQFHVPDTMPPPPTVVAVAISGSRKSKVVVRWALEKFVLEEKVSFRLLHIRPKITAVPTPMGNSIPISEVRDDVAAAFRREKEWQTVEMLLPYKNMCLRQKVEAKVVQIESDDVVNALTEEVSKHNIKKLVIGTSSRGLFSRGQSISSKVAEYTPGFCTVYVVSKGKLSSVRPSDSGSTKMSGEDDFSESGSRSISNFTEWTDQSSTASSSRVSSASLTSLPHQRLQALSMLNRGFTRRRMDTDDMIHQRMLSTDLEGIEDNISEICTVDSSFREFSQDEVYMASQASISDMTDSSPGNESVEMNINFELEKLRVELRHLRQMYAVAQSEAIDASRKLNDLNKRRLEDSIKLKETILQEKEAKKMAEEEKTQSEAAQREAEYMKLRAEREASQKREAEAKAIYEAKEREKLANALVGDAHQYQRFSWEDIETATSSFSEDLRIGMGAYGTVYKCSFHHTTAAVKVLHSKDAAKTKQFEQELEILSKIHHPHLLILLGACPDHGSLVYEFMENGSLEERLLRKDNTLPLPWFDRFRIAWEVASALAFLHNSKPNSIIHRDLKPSNILLDHNLVSKIGDVGLATMVHSDITTSYQVTAPAGTFCYIDPEYQRTGQISPKSDVYAFGIVVLQLLTAKPPMGLAHIMENAVEEDGLMRALDKDGGTWPVEATTELALLALKCTELRSKDRPDLQDQILPTLTKLKDFAEKAREMVPASARLPPNIFICPILKDVMEEPRVAADGYTYDRKAIESWLETKDTSPMTNLPLQHKSLLPNYALLSAIMEWKSGKQ